MNLVNEGVLPPNEPDDRDERREEMEMAQKCETVADIVAELRNKTGNMYDCTITTDEEEFHSYADRIEEVWKREREELDNRISDLESYAKLWTDRADELRLKCDEFYAKAKPVGNAAEMREALELFVEYSELVCKMGMFNRDRLIAITTKARAALSAPPRNCDVGTAEEHAQRFYNFCESNSSGINGMCKPTCPCIDCFDKCQCFAKWEQMPYEEKEGAGNERR